MPVGCLVLKSSGWYYHQVENHLSLVDVYQIYVLGNRVHRKKTKSPLRLCGMDNPNGKNEWERQGREHQLSLNAETKCPIPLTDSLKRNRLGS